MPKIRVNNAEIYYEDTGISDKPAMVFAHGLLWSCRMYDELVERFKENFRCVSFDFRGQGQSEVTESGYDMNTLAQDTLALLDALGIQKCHFVGLSMGGFVGMRVAALNSERLLSLNLLNTAADAEPFINRPKYTLLLMLARLFGIEKVLKNVNKVMFSKTFLAEHSRHQDKRRFNEWLLSNNMDGMTRAVKGVISRESYVSQVGSVDVPTQIIVGAEDAAIHEQRSYELHELIQYSKYHVLEEVGHMSVLEQPQLVGDAIQLFFDKLSEQEQE